MNCPDVDCALRKEAERRSPYVLDQLTIRNHFKLFESPELPEGAPRFSDQAETSSDERRPPASGFLLTVPPASFADQASGHMKFHACIGQTAKVDLFGQTPKPLCLSQFSGK